MHHPLSLIIAAAILYMVIQLQKDKDVEKPVTPEADNSPTINEVKSTTLEISPQGNFL